MGGAGRNKKLDCKSKITPPHTPTYAARHCCPVLPPQEARVSLE